MSRASTTLKRPRRPLAAKVESTGEVHGIVFPSELGWFAMQIESDAVRLLKFGYASWREAVEHVGVDLSDAKQSRFTTQLIKRLQAYAQGKRDNFLDVPLAEPRTTAFAQEVVEQCRRIAPGAVLSYGQLAEAAGAPRAARAVGSVMSSNKVAIIVPCHRVVGSGGRVGGYSLGAGVPVKCRLLELEKGYKTRRK